MADFNLQGFLITDLALKKENLTKKQRRRYALLGGVLGSKMEQALIATQTGKVKATRNDRDEARDEAAALRREVEMLRVLRVAFTAWIKDLDAEGKNRLKKRMAADKAAAPQYEEDGSKIDEAFDLSEQGSAHIIGVLLDEFIRTLPAQPLVEGTVERGNSRQHSNGKWIARERVSYLSTLV